LFYYCYVSDINTEDLLLWYVVWVTTPNNGMVDGYRRFEET